MKIFHINMVVAIPCKLTVTVTLAMSRWVVLNRKFSGVTWPGGLSIILKHVLVSPSMISFCLLVTILWCHLGTDSTVRVASAPEVKRGVIDDITEAMEAYFPSQKSSSIYRFQVHGLRFQVDTTGFHFISVFISNCDICAHKLGICGLNTIYVRQIEHLWLL